LRGRRTAPERGAVGGGLGEGAAGVYQDGRRGEGELALG